MLPETIPAPTRAVLLDVVRERLEQDAKWPVQMTSPTTPWLAILVEEVGEAARAVLNNASDGPQDLRAELVQVAAVACAWVEWLDRADNNRGE